MCVCVSAFLSVHDVCAGVCGCQERESGPLGLKLQVIVALLMWVL